MMNMKKIFAVIAAAALPLSMCGCTYGYQESKHGSSRSSTVTDAPQKDAQKFDYETADIDRVNDEVKALLAALKKEGNEAEVKKYIATLIDEANNAYDAMSYSSVASNLDFYNTDLEDEYDANTEALYVIQSAVMYAFGKGCNSKYYGALFEEYLDEKDKDYFCGKGLTLSRVEGYASVDFRASDEKMDDYFDIAYDKSLKDDEKALKAAEVYLDIIANQDPETFYTNYYRDYTPEDIISLSGCIREVLEPEVDKILDKFDKNKHSDDVFDDPVLFDDLFGTVKEYSPRLSKDIEKSAKKMIDDELYTIASGDECYTGSYTIDLPSQNSALVYIYSDDSYFDLTTAIHEFGHFHSSFYDDTNAVMASGNIDICEIQSQAMELLFLQFYDELYGEQSDAMKLLSVGNMAENIVVSFLIGEFEYTALTRADELTPEEVLDLYDEIMGDLAISYPFMYMTHIFQYPGYYISYGVSALAAMDILDECLNDPERAVEMYEKIAKVPSNDKELQFRGALEQCGLSDVLTEDYIAKLGKELEEFAVTMK